MSASLPVRANLDWLRKVAKERLAELRKVRPDATLSDAQLAVAREHGFSSWRAMKARVDEIRAAVAMVAPAVKPSPADVAAIAPDDPDLIALFKAVHDGDARAAATLVTRRPALVRARGAEGQTALHVAAEANDVKLGAYLVVAGADPGAKFGDSGHTALSWAVTCHAMEFATAMMRLGAKPDLFCAAGMGALDAVRAWFDDAGALTPGASQTGSSRFGADGIRLPCPPSTAREQISDALYIAARNAHVGVVRFLLDKSPDVSFKAYLGATPLHWAYFGGSSEVADLLVHAGADPASRENNMRVTPRAFGICTLANWGFGFLVRERLRQDRSLAQVNDATTPLHEAAREGHLEVVQILLEAGADRSIRDREGRTAAELAEANGHEAVVETLR
jgi:ankyrin repeat protein